MDRLFDINLSDSEGWTDGEYWEDCNPAQDIDTVYHRIYSASEDDDIPTYRLEYGDNFFIGAASDKVRDWTPKTSPWLFDIDGIDGGQYSFYFGLQLGESRIDTTLKNHSPWLINVHGELIQLNADYHRFYGLKAKSCCPIFTLKKNITGLTVDGAVLSNTSLFNTAGYSIHSWKLRRLTFLDITVPMLDVPANSSNISLQNFTSSGEGDCGIKYRSGHTNAEIIGGKLTNENALFGETGEVYHGVELEQGDKAIVRSVETEEFSGIGFKFGCEVDAKDLISTHDNAGCYFAETSTVRGAQVNWTRSVSGLSFGYYAVKDLTLNNSGCQLDETNGLGVIVLSEGSTVTVNGGDYKFNPPLPYATAVGDSTLVLNNVTINGELYNETITFEKGESWRGIKATVNIEPLPVYANGTLVLPWQQIPELANAVSVEGSERPFDEVVTLVDGSRIAAIKGGSARFIPGKAHLDLDPGETREITFRYSTSTTIYVHKFIVHASPEVGAKVVQPTDFSGSGWSLTDGAYHASGTSNPLTASYAFEQNEIYQVSIEVDNTTQGSVKPQIGSELGQYSHSINDVEVWLIRAPNGANAVSVLPDSFAGEVGPIYVRKLLRTETPAVPELEATVNGNTVNLAWYLTPIERISDTESPRVYITGELNQTEKDGYKNSGGGFYLFEDVYCSGKKTGINLRGGDALEVWKMEVTGGYEGEFDTWQSAISTDQNRGPYLKKSQICYLTCDLGLDSNRGGYTSEFGNSDPIVLNGITNQETFESAAFILGLDGRNGSDAIVDTKKYTEINHSSHLGGYRQLRVHNVGTALVANSDFDRNDDSRQVFTPTHSHAIIEVWNCIADGERCVSVEQMLNVLQPEGTRYAGFGQVGPFLDSIEVLKTYPTINNLCRVAMTDMEFEYSTDSGTTWQILTIPNIGLPGVVGMFKRSINFSSGTYQIRCRCLNGALTGAWSNSTTITV